MEVDQEVAIAELETLAFFLCAELWSNLIQCRHVLFCLDNEVSNFCLIKDYSHASMVCRMVNAICIYFEKNLILPSFLRVPSYANISDFPSRQIEHRFLENDVISDDALVKNAFNKVASGRLHAAINLRGVAGPECRRGEKPLLLQPYSMNQEKRVRVQRFINMIDYYLQRAVVVSSCSQTKTAARCQKFSHVHFSALAGQVTQQYK